MIKTFLMSRRTLMASTFATTAVLLGGIAVNAADRNIMTLAYPTSFPDLDPSTSFSNDNAVVANVYEPLVWYKPGTDGKEATLEPGLALSWTASDGGKTWTFKLREGVTFHDGTAFDSAAVRFSIERTKKINGGAAFIWGQVTGIETPDANTVVFKLSDAAALDQVASSGYAAWMISPKAADKDATWFNSGQDAGTGPYTIVSHAPGQQTILKAYDKYWGGHPEGHITDVVMQIVEDPILRQQKIESGEADWTMQLPTENLGAFKDSADVALVVNPAFQNLFGMLNTAKKPLDNPKVRQALSHAFPTDDFIKTAMAGYASAPRGIIPTGMLGHDPEAPQYGFDTEKAKALLAEAGVAEGSLKLSMTYATGDTVEETAGQLWKAALAKIGVELTLQPMAWEAQWALGKSDPAKAQDIFVMYWWPTYVNPYDFLFNIFHSEPSPNYNLGYYKNAAFDTLIDTGNGLAATDKAAALAKFKEAQRMAIGDAAAVFMMDQQNIHLIRKNITGYVDNPAYGHVVFFNQLSRK